MPIKKTSALYVAPSPISGRGVFSYEDIQKGDIIELCPVILIPEKQLQDLDQTELFNYYFFWNHGQAAVVLGYGSIYNHAVANNADYEMDYVHDTLDIYCLKDITAGVEITISYVSAPDDTLWFDVKK